MATSRRKAILPFLVMVTALPVMDLLLPSGVCLRLAEGLIGVGILAWVTAWYFGKFDEQGSS